MMPFRLPCRLTAAAALLTAAAALLTAPAAAYEVIRPGPNAWEELQEALMLLKPGEAIGLSPGVFHLQGPLEIRVEGAKVQGAGSSRTILSFAPEAEAAPGIRIGANGVRLSALSVQDARKTAILLENSVGVAVTDVRLEWSADDSQPPSVSPAPSHPAGIAVSGSQDILLSRVQVRGLGGIGISVDNSVRVLIHRAQLRENTFGIRLSDSEQVDVRDSRISHNGLGIWVQDEPGNDLHAGRIRLFNNRITDNSDFRFALGGSPADLPPFGTGIVIASARLMDIFSNQISRHSTTNLLIGSSDNRTFPDRIHIYSNSFGPAGYAPDLIRAEQIIEAASGQLADIVWDGTAPWPELLGLRRRDGRVLLTGNQDADFANLNLPWLRWMSALHFTDRNIDNYSGNPQPLPPFRFAVTHLRVPVE